MLTMWSGNVRTNTDWIEPRWPEDSARGLFSLRDGGLSDMPYASLNVGLAVGDEPSRVLNNRRRVAEELGGDLSEWVLGRQVHKSHVHVVNKEDEGCGAMDVESSLPNTDGLITNLPDITLAVLAADCVPVLFYDAVSHVIGAAHSGWKGTVARISGRVVKQMTESYGSRPQDIHVWLGPSIRQCCYEVDERVAALIRQEFGKRFLIKRSGRIQKYLLGLQACIRQNLLDEGVPSSQVHDIGLCTACRVRHLYSHRQEAGQTGRSLGVIRLLQ